MVKPFHNRYLLFFLDEDQYIRYATVYSASKRWGVRGIYAFLCGTGLWGIVKEVVKGTVVEYGKRRIATIVIGAATYVSAPAVAVLTKANRVVGTCKVVYTTIGSIMEACEDLSQSTFIPLDFLLFGQVIMATKPGRYSTWSNITDLINNLPKLDLD